MRGFGIHTSMWAMDWTVANAEHAVSQARKYPIDFIEIPLLEPDAVDADHTRRLLDEAGLGSICSLGLPEEAWASQRPDAAIDYLKKTIDVVDRMGCTALAGVTYGGIGERTGLPPTQKELDNVARALEAAARHAKSKNIELGIEGVNRYENHLLNTGWQLVAMIERVGAGNLFAHLDTYHMNIEEKGIAQGILDCRDHLKYIHLSESDRGIPGAGNCGWDEIFTALAAIGFKGGMAMESFISLPPQIAYGLSVWRPVADSAEQVMERGFPFLRNKAEQYGLVPRTA